MLGKLFGRLAYRGWRDGWRADRRWARGRDERRWRRDFKDEMDPYEPHGWFCHCRFCRAPSEQVVTDSTVTGPVTQVRNVTGDVKIGE